MGEIPALVNTSGIGYNTSTSGAENGRSELGAYITSDNVLHSLQLPNNGQQLPPLDITNAVADISSYLRPGQNVVTVIVPTTWWKYLRTILHKLESAGSVPLLLVLQEYLGVPLPTADLSSLMASVRTIPFKKVVC